MAKKTKKEPEPSSSWIVKVAILTFILSFIFSYISAVAVSKLNIPLAIITLLVVVLLGITFDLIGVSVSIANPEDFHAMASKRIPGSKEAIKLIKNSAQVSNFCADVIGDICGVLSGSLAGMISLKLAAIYGMEEYIQILVAALVAALTVGGKAFTKDLAKKDPTSIVFFISKIISTFKSK